MNQISSRLFKNLSIKKYFCKSKLADEFFIFGVIIIDMFGFTSRRFECKNLQKFLATETLVDGCRHIHQLVHSKIACSAFCLLPGVHTSPQCLVTLCFMILYSIQGRGFVKYLLSKNVSIHWRQMLGDCKSNQGCLENHVLILSALSCFFSLNAPLSTVKN